MAQPGFFDVDERLKRLSDIGDQLEAYSRVVDFEIFRAGVVRALNYSDGSKGGRPRFDPVLMFKILVIQAENNLSDDRTEFLINDRLSLMRFPGLGLSARVPDAKTIRAFRERLTKAGAIDGLFARFDGALREAGCLAMGGQLVDATPVAAPKQRNSDSEKRAIKSGKSVRRIWPDKPNRARQKDVNARWTVQFGKAKPDGAKPLDIAIPTFGYKAHATICKTLRFIRRRDVSDASRHDGRFLRRGLLDRTNTGSGVWADSAYRSKQNEAFMEAQGFVSHVHRGKPAGKPMPDHIRRGNATRSKHRAPIEHVFAYRKSVMGMTIRTIGFARAKTKIGMANIVYNIRRLAQISQRQAA